MKLARYELTDRDLTLECLFLPAGRSWVEDRDMAETVGVRLLAGIEDESASLASNKAAALRYAAALLLSLAYEIEPV